MEESIYPQYLITNEALEKAETYTKIISGILGFPAQCRGLTLNLPNKNDGITRDIQIIQGDLSKPFIESDLVKALNNDEIMIPDGIWHSHSFEPHSKSDYTLLERLYQTFSKHEKYSPINLIYKVIPKLRNYDNILGIEDTLLEINNKWLRWLVEKILKKSKLTPYNTLALAKSLVLIRDNSYDCAYSSPKIKKVKLKKVKEKNDIKINPDELYDEVVQNTSYNGKPLKEFTDSSTKNKVLYQFSKRKSKRKILRKMSSIRRSQKKLKKQLDDLERKITILENQFQAIKFK